MTPDAIALGEQVVAGAGSGVLQVSAVGGSTAVAVATIAAFVLSLLLATFVTYRYARGYLRTRRRPLLLLAVGLLLLAPVPMFLRVFLGNVTIATSAERTLLVSGSKLCGLLVVLAVVYR